MGTGVGSLPGEGAGSNPISEIVPKRTTYINKKKKITSENFIKDKMESNPY